MEVATVQQVLGILPSHHENITRREMLDMATKIDNHKLVVDRAAMAVRNELQYVAQEVRSSQLELSRRQCLLGGFPTTKPPTERNAFIECTLLPMRKKLKYNHWHSTGKQAHIDCWAQPMLLIDLLDTEPVTIPTGNKTYGAISILTWKSFNQRKAFCDDFASGATITVGNKQVKLRNTPSSPLYQRKKEGLLRVFLKAKNSHDEYKEHGSHASLAHAHPNGTPEKKVLRL
jgi:hypothetical protein